MEDLVDETVTVVAVFADRSRSTITEALLSENEDLRLIGRAGTTEEILSLAHDQIPDVIYLELGNPEVDALRVIAEVHSELPVVRVLVVADHLPEDTYELLLAGAAGGLDREEDPTAVSSVVRGVARREAVVPSSWAHRGMTDVASVSHRDPFAEVLRLTDTEREVLERLARKESVDDLAGEYGVTRRLVTLHIGYIVTKLQRHAGYTAAISTGSEQKESQVLQAF